MKVVLINSSDTEGGRPRRLSAAPRFAGDWRVFANAGEK